MQPSFFGLTAACFLLTTVLGFAGEAAVDLTAKAARIYKSEETLASVEQDASGTGVQLNFDFEQGGTTARYEFSLSPPLEGPITNFTITAKGSEGPIIFMVRDATSKGIGYELGPITTHEQTFIVDLAKPASIAGRQTTIEYPLKAIAITIKKSTELKGSIEISKIVAENGD